MKKLSTNEIREIWIDYFKKHDHHIEPSKSLVPINDNSLLFINSGVSTLKNYFSAVETPPNNKIANAQKSIRTNDIENVGITSRHHTLFEMLGNFSIGDYFKQEAIEMAYEILTSKEYYGFDVEKLYFTIHPDDEETYQKWLSLGISNNKIVRLEENFWQIGKGPGGPNTEIFFDRGDSFDNRDVIELLKNDTENDRIIEIWNIVFSQYNCDPENLEIKDYLELPQKNIDTGMGLERMACVMQNVESNFETDNFMAIINKLVSMTNIDYQDKKMAYRVISDHIRALCFSIADGIIPSNEGRGYVIRRILRRAVRFGYMDLGIQTPFLSKLVDTVVSVLQPFYEYLLNEVDFIKEIINLEEEKFFKTLSSGLKLLKEEINNDTKTLTGQVAFKLYDTYGFPIELTCEVANENNIEVDKNGFLQELEKQQNRARAAKTNVSAIKEQNTFLKTIKTKSKFIGYQYLTSNSRVLYITDLEKSYDAVNSGEYYLVFDNTPFYANGGGQINDTGTINNYEILEIIKLPFGQVAHKININEKISVNDYMLLQVDKVNRKNVSINHSATHLLHFALDKIIGSHAKQAGSSQDFKKTRFDFSSFKALETKEIIKINDYVNELILQNEDVVIKEMDLDSAKKMGANALFSEKYGDIVRVVMIGDSMELCAGTHVKNTSEIGKFQIIVETGIGSGVRRIEALCNDAVDDYTEFLLSEFNKAYQEIKNNLEKNKINSTNELEEILSKMKILYNKVTFEENYIRFEELKQKIQIVKSQIQTNNSTTISNIIQEIVNNKIIVDGVIKIDYQIENIDPKDLKKVSDQVANVIQSGIIILKVLVENKVSIVVKVTDDLTNTYSANDILKECINPYHGRGGGKNDIAQGGYQI